MPDESIGKRYFISCSDIACPVSLIIYMLFNDKLTRPEMSYSMHGTGRICRYNGTEDPSFMNRGNIKAMLLSGDVTSLAVKAGTDEDDARRIGLFWNPAENPFRLMFRIYHDFELNDIESSLLEKYRMASDQSEGEKLYEQDF